MTEKPNNVRIATEKDEKELLSLLMNKLYYENGTFGVCPEKVIATIKHATQGNGGIIGIIEGNGEIAGTIGMQIDQFWYSDDWYLCELWNFVHPDYRKSEYAKNLIDFGKWASEQMKMILNIGIISTHRTEAKVRLYQRKLTPVGMFFMHNISAAKGPAALGKAPLGV